MTDRLVIVEDQLLFATSLAALLRQQGQEVETIAGPSVEVVVDTVRRLAPVLVLLDLVLGPPLGSGLDLIQPLTAAGGGVVMMTGELDRARLGACIEAGALGVVSKTTGFRELVDAIGRAGTGEELLTRHQRQILLDALHAARQAEERQISPFVALSPREQAVLARLMVGESAETIATVSCVALTTVRTQIRSILKKLGVQSQVGAVALARQASWPRATTQ